MNYSNDIIEVVITDGNRTVNEEHKGDETFAGVLKKHGFNWIKGTLRVNDVLVTDLFEDVFISCHIKSVISSSEHVGKLHITCKTPDNDPSKLTSKQLAKLREKQKTAESVRKP